MKLVYLKTFFTQIHFTLIQAQCYTLILSKPLTLQLVFTEEC